MKSIEFIACLPSDERGRLTDLHDIFSKKEALRLHFGGLDWECRQILEAMDSCTELYLDPARFG